MSTITSNAAAVSPASLDYTNLPPGKSDEPVFWGLTATAWVKVAIVSALLVALFRFNLARLWTKTNPFTGEANWGHSTIIPLIGLYYLYLNRDQLLAAKVKPIFFERFTRNRLVIAGAAIVGGLMVRFLIARFLFPQPDATAAVFARGIGTAAMLWGAFMLVLGWGLGNMLFGMLVFVAGISPVRNDWVSDYGMVHTIFGIVLTLCGWEVMRVAWFPIAFLLCGLPWPGLVYSWVANPLQHLAAWVAAKALNHTGIPADNPGTKILIQGANGVMRPLNVAEACAGLRSLMTFISVAAAVAFLSNRAFWQKVVITMSAVPIAIFCNVMRVTGQAYLDRLAGPQWSENFAHQFVGVVMLIPAFFLILAVAWILDQIFIEEVDDKSRLRIVASTAAGRAMGRPSGAAAAAVGASSAARPAASDKKVIVIPPRTPAAAAKAQPAVAGAAIPAPAAAPAPAKAVVPPAKAPAPASPPPARLPPRTNLTGRPARPDRPTEGA